MADEVAAAIASKHGDVYRFVYSAESWEKAKSGLGHGDLHWCFDGQVIYRDDRLCDTYWGMDWRGDNGRSFTLAEARAKGTLTFVCNLNDVEKIRPEEHELYAAGDAFNLSHQHGCYRHYVKRKGAKRDKDRQLAALSRKVQSARDDLDRARMNLELAVAHRERTVPLIEAGGEPCI